MTVADVPAGVRGSRRRFLPEGHPLPDDVWAARHRAMLGAALASAGVILVWGVLTRGLTHGVLDAAPILVATLIAAGWSPGRAGSRREPASCAVMVALMFGCAGAVHLSGGLIEAHFLFFIAVGAASTYQTWAPLLTAVAFVVLHHGVLGTLSSHAIFNHPAAQDRPWLWGLIHGGLLAGAAAVGIASWRADELVRMRLAGLGARSRLIMHTVEDGIVAVDGRGRVAQANPAALRLLGGDETILGHPLCELVPGVCDEAQMRELVEGRRPAVPRQTTVRLSSGRPGEAHERRVAVHVVPVRGDDAVRAVVTLRDTSAEARAETAELALVDLAEREQAQREDVAALQAAVRPSPLAVAGLELGVSYAPAASAPAGGDLYDWLVLPSGELLLVVVDALGRGTGATREALAVTSTVRTLAVAGCPLHELVARAGEVLDVTHPDLLATLLVAVVDPTTGRVRLAGGGHPPALVVTTDGAREVCAEGLGVGYVDPGSHGIGEVTLAPGETLLLYTDGLVEGTRDLPAGLRALAATAASLATEPVDAFARRLLLDVPTSALDDDDCLVLAVRRSAPPATGESAQEHGALVREVPPLLAEVPRARAAARTWLTLHRVDPTTADTCLLLVSELVTNAVRHSGTPARLRLRRTEDGIEIQVTDGSPEPPSVRESDEESLGGRGMHLVSVLASRWDVQVTGTGKTVRCAVATPSPVSRGTTRGVPAGRPTGDGGLSPGPSTSTGWPAREAHEPLGDSSPISSRFGSVCSM